MTDGERKSSLTKAEKIILLALILGAFMTSLDATIVSVAIPTMAQELGEEGHNTSNISWVLLIYTLMLSCFILLWSKIGSNIGYKKVFMTGIAVFSLSSLAIGACGFIPELGLGAIILLRAVQGLGAGMAMAMSLARTTTYLPVSARGASIGAVTLAASCGTAFGPAVGGILTTIHWSYIFFINVPIGLICLFLCMRYMKVKESPPEKRPRIDALGVVFMFVMMFSFIYSPRDGTPAAKEVQMSEKEKTDRYLRLLKVQEPIAEEMAQRFVGRTEKVLVEGRSKNNKEMFTGRDSGLKIVLFEGNDEMTGRFTDIEITEAHAFALYGKVIKVY